MHLILLQTRTLERVYLISLQHINDQRKLLSYIFMTPCTYTYTGTNDLFKTRNQRLVTISNANGCLSYVYKVR